MTSSRFPPPHRPQRPAPDPGGCDPAKLDDRDLLALMLRHAAPDAPSMADALLAEFDGLGGVAFAEAGALERAVGLGQEAARDLQAMRELAVRLARVEACRRPVITTWTALIDYARTALARQPREQFRVLYLDRRNILLRDEFIAEGTVDHAPVYPREVVRRALELSASALILVHNHPSGDPSPSRADIEMTRRIVDAARVFNLQVHDHLVVGREGTASFKSLGLI